MVVSNVDIVERKLTELNVVEEDKLDLSGKYVAVISNTGKIRSPRLSLSVSSLEIDNNMLILDDVTKSIGRLKGEESTELNIEFSTTVDKTSSNLQTVDELCNNNQIKIYSEENIRGLFLSKVSETDTSIDIEVSECNLDDDDEESADPEPSPDEPQDSDSEDNSDNTGNQDGSSDEDDTPESADLDINGPVAVKVGRTYDYEVNEYPNSTEVFQWNSFASEQNITEDNQYEITFNEVDSGTVAVRAIDENNMQVGLGELDVLVVGEDQSQARDSNSEIEGLRFVSLNQVAEYTWDSFPEETIQFNWQVLEEEGNEESDVSLERNTINPESMSLDFQSSTEGNYLIVIAAIANGEVIDQVNKQVSVVPTS